MYLCAWTQQTASSPTCLSPLLVQPFPEVSDAFVHDGDLGVPPVQQLLAVGQVTALLQVVAVTGLTGRSRGARGVH